MPQPWLAALDEGGDFLLYLRHVLVGKGQAGAGEVGDAKILVKHGAALACVQDFAHIVGNGVQHFIRRRRHAAFRIPLHLPQAL